MQNRITNRLSLTENARALRCAELSRLFNQTVASVTAALRDHHEAALRRSANRLPRVKRVIDSAA